MEHARITDADRHLRVQYRRADRERTETLAKAKTRFEGLVGRPLASVRDFLSWDSAFPTTYGTEG